MHISRVVGRLLVGTRTTSRRQLWTYLEDLLTLTLIYNLGRKGLINEIYFKFQVFNCYVFFSLHTNRCICPCPQLPPFGRSCRPIYLPLVAVFWVHLQNMPVYVEVSWSDTSWTLVLLVDSGGGDIEGLHGFKPGHHWLQKLISYSVDRAP